VCRRHASHITVVLSKAAHSGPSVCLRARAPCPLRVSCPGTDRAERAAQAAGVSVQPSCRRERAVQTAGSCASVPPLVKTEVTPRAPTRHKTRGSRLGSLYYDNITTLAILPCVCLLLQDLVQSVCVFFTAGPSTKLFTWGGGGYGRTCATRDDEPRPVWTSLPITRVCLLLQDLVQSVCVFFTAGPSTKLFTWGGMRPSTKVFTWGGCVTISPTKRGRYSGWEGIIRGMST
jgi:hypothetical protein